MAVNERFDAWYAQVNAEWPQYGMTEEAAADQARRWKYAMGEIPTHALAHALKRALATSKKRPSMAELLAWANEAAPRQVGLPERPVTHATECDCGCGGKKWYKLLRDWTGNVRTYPNSVGEVSGVMPSVLAGRPEVAATLEQLVGQPMLRMRCACRKYGGDPLPPDTFRLGFEEGLPVYDTKPALAVAA